MGAGGLLGRQSSKDVAMQRLKLVLIHDRADISPAFVQAIRKDMIEVLSKYVEIDRQGLDMELKRVNASGSGAASALVCNIPFKKVKNMH